MSARLQPATDDAATHVDPRPDEVIFRNVSVDAGEQLMSRYGDDHWILRPMAKKSTTSNLKVDFKRLPEVFQPTARRIVWTLINERTPMDQLVRPTAIRSRLSSGSIAVIFHDLRHFLGWLADRGLAKLADVTDADFRAYADVIAQQAVDRGVKGRRLFAVTRIWLLAPYLPPTDQMAPPTWEREDSSEQSVESIIGPANWTGENKTPPIHPQSMSALFVAAIRVIEVFGPDISSAVARRQQLLAAAPSRLVPDSVKVSSYVEQLRASSGSLPGMQGKRSTSAAVPQLAKSYLAAKLHVRPDSLKGLPRSGVKVELGAPMLTPITGRVDGEPWCDAIDFYEVEHLERMLMTACFIVTAYLSGMRSEEVRALRRGSCTPAHPDPAAPPHYEVRGHSFKDAIDEEGNAVPGGIERARPWLVVEPVANAIAVAESLHDGPYVFAHVAFVSGRGSTSDPISPQASRAVMARFTEWWNEFCSNADRPHEAIPSDPDGKIVPGRLRRTLAWFIYRVPGGRIALGLQYGHVRGYTSDGYGSRVASGLRDVFPMEEALAAAETLQNAAQRLDEGEHVSGPAADRFISGVRAYQQMFEGSALTTRQMAALRRDPSLRIYDNPERALACAYDQAKALCHPESARSRSNPSQTPDLSRCIDGCANAARTDSHAAILQSEITQLREEAESPLTPEPIRDRLQTRANRRQRELDTHRERRKAP